MTRAMQAFLAVALAAPLAGSVTGCDEDKKPSTEAAKGDGGAGADKLATADPKLAKALQAAASASAGNDTGPPPNGVFAEGAADHRHAKGAPTKVEIVSDGTAPKVALGPGADASTDAARASSYGLAGLETLAVANGRPTPTIDFTLMLGPAKKDDGGADVLVATVKGATPAKQQLAQMPPGLDKLIGSMQGTEFRMKVTPDGRESDITTTLGKASRPELDELAKNAAEALVVDTVPLPDRPVGVGAQWIAESRMQMQGVDVVAYRAYRIKSIDGDRMHLTVDVKAYAADKNVQVQGLPDGSSLEQFDAEAQGELDLVRGEILARKADVKQQIVLVFAGPGGATPPQQAGQPPGNMLTAQVQGQATLVRGDDLRQALKQP
ncbi:MAG TPA: hypothetical protein VF765_15745 [Polyangiaceae bacterium]